MVAVGVVLCAFGVFWASEGLGCTGRMETSKHSLSRADLVTWPFTYLEGI
jgi:hypothetical protein